MIYLTRAAIDRAAQRWRGKFTTAAFVLSTGRTGTQALANHLDAVYSDATALHEPKPTRHLRLISHKSIAGTVSEATRLRALATSRSKLFDRLTTPVYIESNWYLFGFVSALQHLLGRPKVLHVVRDPRSYIPSYLNFGTFSGLKAVATNLVPYWYPRPEQIEEKPEKTWRQMSPAERLAYHWSKVNGAIDATRERLGEDYRFVRFEDLFNPDGAVLRDTVTWLGLAPNEELPKRVFSTRVNASGHRGEKHKTWETLLPEDRKAVLARCGELMNKYGYSP